MNQLYLSNCYNDCDLILNFDHLSIQKTVLLDLRIVFTYLR